MRTTLDIDDDVLQAVTELARREQKAIGAVISELARRALARPDALVSLQEPHARHGFRPFGKRGSIVTNELVDALRFHIRATRGASKPARGKALLKKAARNAV
jgi:hypothetical protein